MENLNPTTLNSKENIMPAHMIKYIFESFITDGGSPKVTEFKKHLDALVKSEIKPLCSRSGKSADGTGWRSELKARFSGRGAKWVQIDIDQIEATLDSFEADETKDYREFIKAADYAWLRFAGPRIADSNQAAAFEVRVAGSTVDHPKHLHYIAVDQLDALIRPLNGTPHSLGLETQAKPAAVEPEVEAAEAVETDAELETTVAPEAEEVEVEAFDIDAIDEPEIETDESLFDSFDELYEDEEGFTEL